jgi:hypothetical protein
MTVPDTDRSRRGRAAEAFRALDAGGDLAKRRVWHRVELGIAEDRMRRRRRLAWMAGIAASAVAALALVLPSALDAAQTWAEPSAQEQQRVAVAAVMEMLGGQQAHSAPGGDASGVSDFAGYLVTEANTGAD